MKAVCLFLAFLTLVLVDSVRPFSTEVFHGSRKRGDEEDSPECLDTCNSTCLTVIDICDGFLDCGYMSFVRDEFDCGFTGCGGASCPNGDCIALEKLCDENDDCGDGHDESKCDLERRT